VKILDRRWSYQTGSGGIWQEVKLLDRKWRYCIRG